PLLRSWLIRCKRQYIRGTIFTTVQTIPLGDLRIGDQADGKGVRRNTQNPPHLGRKFLETGNRNFHLTLLIEDHETRLGPMGFAGGMRGSVFVVRFDNTLDQAVAYDVVLVEINHGDSFDLADDFDGFDQPRAA